MPGEKKIMDISQTRICLQLSLIFLYFSFFYDSALVFRGFINLSPVIGVLIAVLLNGGLLFFGSASLYLFLRNRKCPDGTCGPVRMRIGKCLLSKIPILVVITTFSVLALFQFDHIARHDAGQYYSPLITATETFTFDLASIFTRFALVAHPTQGFSLLIGAGEMLFPMKSVGVYGVTLLLTIVSMLCLYDLIPALIPKATRVTSALGVAVFVFNPYILGLFTHTSPDYYLTLFWIIMAWAFQKKLHILGMFASLLVCFSKEPGILFASFFLLTTFIVQIARQPGRGFFRKAIRYMWPKYLLLYAVVPSVYLLYYRTVGRMDFYVKEYSISPLRWDNTGMYCFGFNPSYITVRSTQLLVYNFYWIPIVLCLAGAAYILIKGYRSRNYTSAPVKNEMEGKNDTVPDADTSVIAGIAGSTVAYFVFSCLFITHMCPRYTVCMAFPAAILCVGMVHLLVRKRYLAPVILAVIAALFLGQCYAEIDPTINLTCNKIDLGKQTIYSPTSYWFNADDSMTSVTEVYVHNTLYTYPDDLTVEAMKKLKITKDDVIAYVFPESLEIYLPGDPIQTDHLIYWDPISQRRTYEDNIEGAFVPGYKIYTADYLHGNDDLKVPDRFYLMTTFHCSTAYVEDIMRRDYDLIDSFTVENSIGILNVYTFEKS